MAAGQASREDCRWMRLKGTFANEPLDSAMSKVARREPAEVCAVLDWATHELPLSWVDQVAWRKPRHWPWLWRCVGGKQRMPVQLPEGLPGADWLPRYLLQEFHNLPNGNYSKSFTSGYARGFDRAMLGTLQAGRARIARALQGAHCALDLGSGAGHLAGALQAHGIAQVYGLEPSPYLLQQAARSYPGVHWVHAVAEHSGLPVGQFDAVGVCFVFHEIPPRYLYKALAELARITQPGARLAIIEPSAQQWNLGYAKLWRLYGWRGVYFRALARRAFEPFADAWHKQDVAAVLAAHGFSVLEDDVGCPLRFILAQRVETHPEPAVAH